MEKSSGFMTRMALPGLVFIRRIRPETKGRSLEALETVLVRN